MKKHLYITGKALGFFVLWLLSTILLTIPAVSEPSFLNTNAAFLRLWWELLPLLGILLATGIFVLVIEKSRIRVPIFTNSAINIFRGFMLGCIWLGVTVIFLFLIGVFSFGDKNSVTYLPIWFIAALLNVVMQNYLVRGYLFSLFREKYNEVAAVMITTMLFTALHGGAFEAGIIAVLNVATMSVFMSLVLIFTESLLAPIMAHFIWNSVGGIVFGVVNIPDDYPNLLNSSLTGNALISGGSADLEGSIAVLVMNILLIALMSYLLKKRSKQKTKGI